jgi:hypothetical protein
MTQLTKNENELTSALILNGDLSKLNAEQKVAYYNGYCTRLGLDPFTKPFEILRLNGKEVLYLTRAGAQQLNKLHKVSHAITNRQLIEGADVYQVTARAESDGRYTESIGAVNIAGLKGDAYANAIMKAETKAKRRSTLDLLGLGILDETEVETIPNAVVVDAKPIVDAEDAGIEGLHKVYMKIWAEYQDLMGGAAAAKYHPDNWKEEHRKSAKAYQAAIKTLTEKIEANKVNA